jgi:galactose mutarotase-like enzyme
LSVTNDGDTLPFGLGWHPYLPLSQETRVQARTTGYWLEKSTGSPRASGLFAAGSGFNQPAPLPKRWVNNGFSGWDGIATIRQPGLGYQLSMTTEPSAPCYFVFVSDPMFDKGYKFDFFCFEPMSHAPDDHHRPGFGQLTVLAGGESLRQEMVLKVRALSPTCRERAGKLHLAPSCFIARLSPPFGRESWSCTPRAGWRLVISPIF